MKRLCTAVVGLVIGSACGGETAVGTQDVGTGDSSAEDLDTAHTDPDLSDPDLSDPDISDPDMTGSDISDPDVSESDISEPDTTGSDISDGSDTGESCSPFAFPAIPSVRMTTEGPVAGLVQDGVTRWLGIPYAAPPVGELRFRPTAPALCRSAVLDSAPGPRCPQREGQAIIGDEDCLTLNIWAPSVTEDAPVLVFFHGGGHIQGSAIESLPGGGLLYDGQHLAKALGVVVVTVQYRLGALGWLVHPALTAEDPEGVIGNRGLLDQQAALRWLRAHLVQFGGDPARITIFGESAGAVDTSLHLALPSSRGLFASAIVQSGSPSVRSLDTALTQGRDMVSATACGQAADIVRCLRDLDSEALLTALPGQSGIGSPGIGQGSGNFGPVLDGRLIPEAPLVLLSIPHDDAPTVIVGSNSEEMAELLSLQVQTEAAYIQALRVGIAAPIALSTGQTTDAILDALLVVYPASAYESPQLALEDVYTDLRFTCPAVELLRALETGGHRVHRYLFARRLVTPTTVRPASHGRELPFVFGSWRNIPLFDPQPADRLLSDQMMSAWASVGRSIPELEGGWPEWSADIGKTLVLDAPLTLIDAPREDRCEVWRSFATPR